MRDDDRELPESPTDLPRGAFGDIEGKERFPLRAMTGPARDLRREDTDA